MSMSTVACDWFSTDVFEAASLRTNADGEVSVPWFPKAADYVDARSGGDDWTVDDSLRGIGAEAKTTVHVRHKVAVSGRLKMPAGAGAREFWSAAMVSAPRAGATLAQGEPPPMARSRFGPLPIMVTT